jgi:hypothetical protein
MNLSNESRRTLWNFLLLPIGITAIFLLSIFVENVLAKISPISSDLPAIDVRSLYFGFGLFVFFLVWWTVRVCRDVLKFKSQRNILFANISILLIAYGIPIVSGIGNGINQAMWYKQRNEILANVESYHSIGLDKNSWIFAIENKNDSLYLFMRAENRNVPKTEYKQLITYNSLIQFEHLWLHELHISTLTDSIIIPVNNFYIDSTTLNLKIDYLDKSCDSISYNMYSRNLIIENRCRTPEIDTISGFRVANRRGTISWYDKRFKSIVDEQNNCWFAFYTDDDRNRNPDYMYVGVLGSAQKKVYKIQLKENDKLIFDENRLIGLFKKNNRLYIIARKKIIYFELQNESV